MRTNKGLDYSDLDFCCIPKRGHLFASHYRFKVSVTDMKIFHKVV